MLNTDEDSLICDLAETYGIYDFKRLSPKQVATFSYGLRDNSRIKMILSGMKVPIETVLLAASLDQLNFIAWTKTEDAQNGINKPESIVSKWLEVENSRRGNEVFSSIEEYENCRRRLLGGIDG